MGRAESAVVHQLSGLLASGSLTGVPDRLLLERFVSQSGEVAEAAFAALVARHGPMVLKVCRTMLTDHQDAQDAFQITFVLLAAKANSLRHKQLLANWLYGVAMRSALKLRSNSARRWRHERHVAEQTHEAVNPVETYAEDYTALYEEINALPERYRGPVVLCHLEGLSREMAASLLDCPVNTLNVRLMRARNQLKKRLTRRQAHLPAGLIGSILDGSTRVPLPAPMVQVAMDAASETTGMLSPSLLALAKEIQMAMFMTKIKVVAGLLLTISVVTAGAGTVGRSQTATEPVSQNERGPRTSKSDPQKEPKSRKAVRAPAGTVKSRRITPKIFPNPDGWSWLVMPQTLQSSGHWKFSSNTKHIIGYNHIESTDGSLRVFLVQTGLNTPIESLEDQRPDTRIVVLDTNGGRYIPQEKGWETSSTKGTYVTHSTFILNPLTLDPKNATHIGVEQIVRKQTKP